MLIKIKVLSLKRKGMVGNNFDEVFSRRRASYPLARMRQPFLVRTYIGTSFSPPFGCDCLYDDKPKLDSDLNTENKLTDNILKEGEKEKSFSNVSVIKQKILANH